MTSTGIDPHYETTTKQSQKYKHDTATTRVQWQQKTKNKKNEITLLISKSQDQDRFGPTSERRGSVPDRHDTPIELEPT